MSEENKNNESNGGKQKKAVLGKLGGAYLGGTAVGDLLGKFAEICISEGKVPVFESEGILGIDADAEYALIDKVGDMSLKIGTGFIIILLNPGKRFEKTMKRAFSINGFAEVKTKTTN